MTGGLQALAVSSLGDSSEHRCLNGQVAVIICARRGGDVKQWVMSTCLIGRKKRCVRIE